MRFAALLLAAVSVSGLPAPAAAQLSAAADIGFDLKYIWRGLTRVSKPNLQPALSVAWSTPNLLVSVGGWALLEPVDPGSSAFTLAGPDRFVGEVDGWVQGSYRLRFFSATLDLTAGATAYTYQGEPGPGSARLPDGVEVLAGFRLDGLDQLYPLLGLPADLPVGLEASAAVDLGDVGGWYLETGLRSDLPLFFVGEPFGALIIRLLSGFSWNQEVGLNQPGYYDGEGPTHIGLSVSATPFFRLGAIPLTVNLTGYAQVGFDRATRSSQRAELGSRQRANFETTVSILLPARRTP